MARRRLDERAIIGESERHCVSYIGSLHAIAADYLTCECEKFCYSIFIVMREDVSIRQCDELIFVE